MKTASASRAKKAGRAAKLVIFVLIAAAMIHLIGRATRRTDSEYKYKPFFTEDTDYDVLFFGTSHVLNGIFPMQLWEDYGITSYNFGGHSNSIAMSYWVMRNAVRYHKPKVAVLDVSMAEQQSTQMDNIDFAHLSMDSFPLSLTKIQGVMDVYSDSPISQVQLLWPLFVYHERWPELKKEDLRKGIFGLQDATKEKGAESRVWLERQPAKHAILPETDMIGEDTVALQYVRKFIDFCHDNDIQPVLMFVPYPAPEERQMAANRASLIAEETGTPFLDMLEEDIVDFDIDCFDPESHLNPSGARKVTDFLGNYFSKNCNLTSHKDDAAYADLWDRDYSAYKGFLKYLFSQIGHPSDPEQDPRQTLCNLLMLLYNENFRGNLSVSEAFVPDKVEQKLIDQLGDNLTLDTNLQDQSVQLTIYDKSDGSEVFQYQI